MEEQVQAKPRFNFQKVFEYCILGMIFFLPVAFLPSSLISLYSVKIALLVTFSLVLTVIFLARTLLGEAITFPKTKLLIPAFLFPITALVSSFFSGQLAKSIAGQIFELGTSGSLLILFLLFFVVIFLIKDETFLGIKAIFVFLFASLFAVLHLLLKAFGSFLLPSSVFSKIPNFLIGGPIDTSIFFGGTVIVSLCVLNMLPLDRKVRFVIYGLILFGMLFMGAIGFASATIVVGLFALSYVVYTFTWPTALENGTETSTKKNSLPSLFVLLIAIFFVVAGSSASASLSGIFKINSIEVRPNFQTTLGLVRESWKVNPVLGVGPNMFKELWDLKLPPEINLTQFWASEFNFGSGLVPTLAVTTGPLGTIILLSFLLTYAYLGLKTVFSKALDMRFKYVASTTFFVSLFLWIMTFVYVPGVVLLSLAFIFSAMFVSTLVPQGVIQNASVNLFRNPKTSFASVFMIVVLLIVSVAGGYFVWEKIIAAYAFQKGNIARSIDLAPTDIYWKSFAESSIAQIGTILGSVSSIQNLDETQKAAIQNAISNSINGSKKAIVWNSKNFQNWFALGRVYEILAANGVEGALDNAKATYAEAQKRAPSNPAIPLALGRLAAIQNDLSGARANIEKAIEMKKNYTDAYFTLAQLEVASNNILGAIRSVEAAAVSDPTNANLFFQLGLLKYNNNDFRGAISAFEEAVKIFPDYANAKYFLGLSYERLGRRSEAIVQFEGIEKTNPDNQEIKLILSNLRAGRSPFVNAEPPVDNKPEKRAEPPIREE